jgi:hypothetical protein
MLEGQDALAEMMSCFEQTDQYVTKTSPDDVQSKALVTLSQYVKKKKSIDRSQVPMHQHFLLSM